MPAVQLRIKFSLSLSLSLSRSDPKDQVTDRAVCLSMSAQTAVFVRESGSSRLVRVRLTARRVRRGRTRLRHRLHQTSPLRADADRRAARQDLRAASHPPVTIIMLLSVATATLQYLRRQWLNYKFCPPPLFLQKTTIVINTQTAVRVRPLSPTSIIWYRPMGGVWLGGRVVRTLNLRSIGREFESRPLRYRVQPWASC